MKRVLDSTQLNNLYRYALSLTANREDAYDLLQTALEKLLRSKQTHRNEMAYLRAIMRNQFIDQCRRNKLIDFEPIIHEENLALLDAEPLEKAIIDEDHVNTLMMALNPIEREALFLWAVMDYTASEIAEETGESRGTILSRLHRIKKKLQHLDTNPAPHSGKVSKLKGGVK